MLSHNGSSIARNLSNPSSTVFLMIRFQQNSPGYNLRVESMARARHIASRASYGARQAIQDMYGEDSLADHHPAMLTPTIVEEADLILVMDRSLLKGLPLEKSYVLKPYFGLEGDVIDPWPDSRDEAAARYTRCTLELREVLEGNIGTIIDALRPRES